MRTFVMSDGQSINKNVLTVNHMQRFLFKEVYGGYMVEVFCNKVNEQRSKAQRLILYLSIYYIFNCIVYSTQKMLQNIYIFILHFILSTHFY